MSVTPISQVATRERTPLMVPSTLPELSDQSPARWGAADNPRLGCCSSQACPYHPKHVQRPGSIAPRGTLHGTSSPPGWLPHRAAPGAGHTAAPLPAEQGSEQQRRPLGLPGVPRHKLQGFSRWLTQPFDVPWLLHDSAAGSLRYFAGEVWVQKREPRHAAAGCRTETAAQAGGKPGPEHCRAP